MYTEFSVFVYKGNPYSREKTGHILRINKSENLLTCSNCLYLL